MYKTELTMKIKTTEKNTLLIGVYLQSWKTILYTSLYGLKSKSDKC